MHAFPCDNDLSSVDTRALSSPDSKTCTNDAKTIPSTLPPGAFMKAFAAKSTGKPNSLTTTTLHTETSTLPLSRFQEKLRPSRSERHPFFGTATESMHILFDDGGDDVDDDNIAVDWLDASISLLALQDGQLPEDDDVTVVASGKRSSSRSSLTTYTTEPSSTGTRDRAAEIQKKIQMMDMDIENTMRVLSELQIDRQNLMSQLLATEDLQNFTGPAIPTEVSFAPKRCNSSSKQRRKSGSKIYHKRKK